MEFEENYEDEEDEELEHCLLREWEEKRKNDMHLLIKKKMMIMWS